MGEQKIPRSGVTANYLTFLIGRNQEQVRIRMKENGIVVGRSTKRASVDLDLKPFDGIRYGVSREHLLIAPKGDYFLVQDLESINSTWLNKVRMKPMSAEELYHGDILHLGELRLQVHYTYDDEVREGLGATTNFNAPQSTKPKNIPDVPESQKSTRVLGDADARKMGSKGTRRLNNDSE